MWRNAEKCFRATDRNGEEKMMYVLVFMAGAVSGYFLKGKLG